MNLQQQLSIIAALSLVFICPLNAMNLSELGYKENNKEQLTNIDMSLQRLSECGICHKRGADVPWSSDYSEFAHKKCTRTTASIEKKIASYILFPLDTHEYNESWKVIRTAVQKVVCDTRIGTNTIKKYGNIGSGRFLKGVYKKEGLDAFYNYLTLQKAQLENTTTSTPR